MQCKEMIGPWTLKDAYMPKDAGRVFSTFACTGGSTMGYKLAGFDVIGMNEIDPKVAAIYIKNHKPRLPFVCSIRDMINKDLPDELYNLDILDGSPPCSSFSTAGSRDRDWGKMKKFAEGQALQRLDDLFFEYIAFAKKIQPKIVVAENVKGLITGKAKGYVKEIFQAFNDANYDMQLFLINACNMGVPQTRPRVFFIGKRKDLDLPKLKLSFNEKPILIKKALSWASKYPDLKKDTYCIKKLNIYPYWQKCNQGESLGKYHPKGNFFTYVRTSLNKPCNTLTATNGSLHPNEPRRFSVNELKLLSSFPMDMNFGDWTYLKKAWAIGMSVPPFVSQRIALSIKRQWIKVLNG